MFDILVLFDNANILQIFVCAKYLHIFLCARNMLYNTYKKSPASQPGTNLNLTSILYKPYDKNQYSNTYYSYCPSSDIEPKLLPAG